MKLLRTCAATALLSFFCLVGHGCSVLVGSDELSEGCGSGRKACGGSCVSSDDPDFGCAAKTCRPCVIEHATARCSAAGQCAVATCQGQFADCNGDGDEAEGDGCEVDTAHDPSHCGGCNEPPCRVAHGVPDCGGSRCSIARCDSGFRDCNFDPRDGCEAELAHDADHCGDCDVACGEARSCDFARCVAAE